MNKICIACQKEYNAKRNEQKYCSFGCSDIGRQSPLNRTCQVCGTLFYSPPNRIRVGHAMFCSKKCKGIHFTRLNMLHFKCVICSIDFTRSKGQVKQGHGKCCSKYCLGLWLSKIKLGVRVRKRITKICKKCGKEFEVTYGRRYRRHCSAQCYHTRDQSGKKNVSWGGGTSFEPHTRDFNDRLKKYIRTRDNHVCVICGQKKILGDKNFPVHHIDYNKSNSKPDNLIALCHSCHSGTNANRDYWYGQLSPIAIERESRDTH